MRRLAQFDRHIVGVRHAVVHERTGDELAAGRIVDRVFHQGLAETVGDRALYLTLDHALAEDGAAIIDRGVGDDIEVAGVGIDLDLGDVAAVRKRQRRVKLADAVELVAHLARAFGGLEQSDLAVGADHLEAAIAIGDVALRCFQRGGGDFLPLFQHNVGGVDDGVAGAHGRARADRGLAGEAHIGVAVTVLDVCRIDAELAGQQAAEHRGVALSRRLHVQPEDQFVVAGKSDRGSLGRHRAGMFEHAGDADAA